MWSCHVVRLVFVVCRVVRLVFMWSVAWLGWCLRGLLRG